MSFREKQIMILLFLGEKNFIVRGKIRFSKIPKVVKKHHFPSVSTK